MYAVDSKLYPFQIYYYDHLFALRRGDPCLGVIAASTEREAINKAKEQGLGGGREVIAAYIADGLVPYRDVKMGYVRGVVNNSIPGLGVVWKEYGYFDEPGAPYNFNPDYLKVMRLTLELRIAEMEKVIEEYPWGHLKMRLRKAKRFLGRVEEALAQ